jgi:hypothetical protein
MKTEAMITHNTSRKAFPKPEGQNAPFVNKPDRHGMDLDAHYAQPRFWDKTVVGRPLTDRRIAFYERQGRYRERRAVWQQNGNRLVYSA